MIVAEEKELEKIIQAMKDDPNPQGSGENGAYTEQDYANVIAEWKANNVHPAVIENDKIPHIEIDEVLIESEKTNPHVLTSFDPVLSSQVSLSGFGDFDGQVKNIVHERNSGVRNSDREQFDINYNPTFETVPNTLIQHYPEYNIDGFRREVENLPAFNYTKDDIVLASSWEKTRTQLDDIYKNEMAFDETAWAFDLNIVNEKDGKIQGANSYNVDLSTTGEFLLNGFEDFLEGDLTGRTAPNELNLKLIGEEVPEGFRQFTKVGNLLYVDDGKGGLVREYETKGNHGKMPDGAIDANNSRYHLSHKKDFKKDLIDFFMKKFNFVERWQAEEVYDLYYDFLNGEDVRDELIEKLKYDPSFEKKLDGEKRLLESIYRAKLHNEFNQGLSELEIKKYMSLVGGVHPGYITRDGMFGIVPMKEVSIAEEAMEDHEVPFLDMFFSVELIKDENGRLPEEEGYIPTKSYKRNYKIFEYSEEDGEEVFEDTPFGDIFYITQHNMQDDLDEVGQFAVGGLFDVLKFTHRGTGAEFNLIVGGEGGWVGWKDMTSSEKQEHFDRFMKFLRENITTDDIGNSWQQKMDSSIADWENTYNEIVELSDDQQENVDAIDVEDVKKRRIYVDGRPSRTMTDEFGITTTIPGYEGYWKTVDAEYPNAVPQAEKLLQDMIDKGTIDYNKETNSFIRHTPNENGWAQTEEIPWDDYVLEVAVLIAKQELTYEYHKHNMNEYDDETGGWFTRGDAEDIAHFGEAVADDYWRDRVVDYQSCRFTLMNQKGVLMKDVMHYVNTFQDPDATFEIIPGEETVILEIDFEGDIGTVRKEIPVRIQNKFLSDVTTIQRLEKEIALLSEKENFAYNQLQSLDYIIDLALIDYNAVTNILTNLGFATLDIFTGLMEFSFGWVDRLAGGDGILFKEYSSYKKAIKSNQYLKSFTTEDNDVLDFLEAGFSALAEAAPHILVVVAVSVATGGAGTVPALLAMGGTSLSVGGTWKADQLLVNPDLHQGELYLKATGYALAEFCGELFKIPGINKLQKMLTRSKITGKLDNIPNEFVYLTKTQKLTHGALEYGKVVLQQNVGELFTTNAQTLIDQGRFANSDETLETLGGSTFVSTIFFGVPLAVNAYKSHSVNPELKKNIRAKLEQSHSVRLEIKQYDNLIKNGKVLNPKEQQEYDGLKKTLNEIDTDLSVLVNEAEANYEKLTIAGRRHYTKTLRRLWEIQEEATNIYNNTKLSLDDKQKLLEVLKVEFNMLQDAATVFRSETHLGDVGRLFVEGNAKENQSEIADLKKRAKRSLKEQGVKNPTQKQINEEAAILKNMDLIEADYFVKRNITKDVYDSLFARSKKDGVQLVKDFFKKELKKLKKKYKDKENKDKFNEIKDQLKAEESRLISNIKDGTQNGTTFKSPVDGKVTTFDFFRNQAENGKTETRTHEEGHAAFWVTLNLNPEEFGPMAQAIYQWVVDNYGEGTKGLYWKIFGMNPGIQQKGHPNYAPEEVVMKFFEEVAKGNVDKLVEMRIPGGGTQKFKRGENNDWIKSKPENRGFLGALQALMNFGMKESTDGKFTEFDFSGADNILDFLIGLGHKIKDGTLTQADLDAIKSAKVIKDLKNETKKKVKNDAELTKDDRTPNVTIADQIYRDKGIAGTWEIMESYNSYLRGLINVYSYVPDFSLHKDIIFEELRIDSEKKRGLYTLIQNFDSRSADYVLEDGSTVKVLFSKKGWVRINGEKIDQLKGKDVMDVQTYVTKNFGPIAQVNPVPLSGYIFSILPDRVKEIAERHLPFEGAMVRPDPGPAGPVIPEQIVEPEDVELESSIDIELGKWSQILGITDEMKQQVIEEVREIMRELGIPEGSKKWRNEMQKYFAEAFKVRIRAIIGTQASGKFDAWLRSEVIIDGQKITVKEALIDYLAVKYRSSFPIMSNDGGRMSVDESHKAQVETPGAWVTDTKGGNTIWVKDYDVNIDNFVDFFVKGKPDENGIHKRNNKGQYSDTQYKALVDSIAKELGLDAVMEAMPPNLENHISKISQIIDRNPNLKMDIEGVIYQAPPDFNKKLFEQQISKIHSLVLDDDIDNVINRSTMTVIGKENDFTTFEVANYVDAYNRGIVESGSSVRFKQGIKESKVIPDFLKDLYKQDGVLRNNNEVLDRLHEDMSNLIVSLGPEIMGVIGYAGFGYSLRVMDPASKKFTDKTKQVQLFDHNGNPVEGDYFRKLEELKARVAASSIPTNIKLEAIRLMNKNFKLFKSIDKIQKGPGTAKEKYDLIMAKHGAEIQSANEANIQLATHITKTLLDNVANGNVSPISAFHFLQIQTGLISGFRGLSRLDFLELKDGELSYNAKGEHVGVNSNTMLKIAELMCRYVKFDENGNVISVDNTIDLDAEIAEILRYHTQLLGDKKTMDKMDKNLGNTSNKNLQRIEEGLPVSDQKNIYNLDFKNNPKENAIDYEVSRNVENINNESSKRSVRQNKRNTIIKNSLELTLPDLGASVFDFDGTVGESDNVVIATKDGARKELDGVQWAEEGLTLIQQGWEMDFSDFNNITNGILGPLWPKLINQLIKYGPANVYILTARAPEVQEALFDFINKEIDKYNEENGTNVPHMLRENIVGLGDSTGEAKADWIEDNLIFNGVNDIYFVDDMPENVQAVGDRMKLYPPGVIKDGGKSVIVKDDKWEFDKENWLRDLMEEVTGIPSFKKYSEVNAKITGKRKGWFKFMLPPNAQDLRGLLENFIPRGRQHEVTRERFEEFIDTYVNGMSSLNKARVEMGKRYKDLKKMMPKIRKILKKKVPGSKLTHEQAVRVYIWSEIMGIDMTQYGLSSGDIKLLTDAVKSNEQLRLFANAMPGVIGLKGNQYVRPSENWLAGNLLTDMHRAHQFDGREDYLGPFIEMKNELFSPQNLIDIEARFGPAVRNNLEKILFRMENGYRKGSKTTDGLVNNFMRWINNSVGAIMFTNMRSATLQLLSTFNYIDMENNTIVKAAAQFANPKKFFNGMMELYRSEFIQTRLFGNMMGINEKDIARIVNSSDPFKALISHLVNLGIAPTKIADATAILLGGTPYYLNQIDYYLKEGYTQEDAKRMAYKDFVKATQRNQQSGEEHMTSNLQNEDLGKIIFAFKNTPMQYVREINLSFKKIYKCQGDFKAEIANIAWYGVVQSFLFTFLQQAVFASLDAEDDEWRKKEDKLVQGMIDNLLNGMGFGGVVTATMKNGVITYNIQEEKGWNADHTYTILAFANMSPSIGSKLRKIYSAIKTKQIYGDAIDEMKWYDPHNPEWAVTASLIEAFTNIPTSRLYQKTVNVETAINSIIAKAYKNSDGTEEGMELAFWQELALFLGWNTYDLGIDSESKKVANEIKDALKKTKEKEKENLKDQKDEEEHINTTVKEQLIEANKREEEGKPKKEVKCSNFKNGKQCKVLVQNPGDFCSYHDPDQSKNYTCGAQKTRGGTCKIETNNYHEENGKMVKSGCYLHNDIK